jgi:putative addiction module component (TIGR02574 family)
MILEMLPEVQMLPPAKKRQLAEELLQSLEASDEVDVDPGILAILESRLAAYEANPSDVVTWEDVKARVFKGHGT